MKYKQCKCKINNLDAINTVLQNHSMMLQISEELTLITRKPADSMNI